MRVKSQAKATIANLPDYTVTAWIETGDKVTRFSPFSAQAEAGNVKIVEGLSDAYLTALENFPDATHKDDADATSGAYHMHMDARGQGMREYVREQAEANRKVKEEDKTAPAAPERTKADDKQSAISSFKNAMKART